MTAIARSEPVQIQMGAKIAENIFEGSAAGALTGSLFSVITPLGGVIFGVTNQVTYMMVNKTLDALGYDNPQNLIAKTARTALPIISAIGTSLLSIYCYGVPLTFSTSLMIGGLYVISLALVSGTIDLSSSATIDTSKEISSKKV